MAVPVENTTADGRGPRNGSGDGRVPMLGARSYILIRMDGQEEGSEGGGGKGGMAWRRRMEELLCSIESTARTLLRTVV